MIDFIVQIDGQNMLQVHYKSGYNRYIFPDEWGNYDSNMTRAQRDFMNNSRKEIMINADGLYRKFTYWLDKDNPNTSILSAIRVKNDLYGQGKAGAAKSGGSIFR